VAASAIAQAAVWVIAQAETPTEPAGKAAAEAEATASAAAMSRAAQVPAEAGMPSAEVLQDSTERKRDPTAAAAPPAWDLAAAEASVAVVAAVVAGGADRAGLAPSQPTGALT